MGNTADADEKHVGYFSPKLHNLVFQYSLLQVNLYGWEQFVCCQKRAEGEGGHRTAA